MMTATYQSASFWQLEQELGITVWENLLHLPVVKKPHCSEFLKLERKLGFTFVGAETDPQVFVSEKTKFFQLVPYLPFLFEKYQLFLCPEHLITERLYHLSENAGSNDALHAGYILDRLLDQAIQQGASDIHLESVNQLKKIKLRVDGELFPVSGFDDVDENVFARIKLISKMDIAQKRSPQDGHFHFINRKKQRFDIRTSSLPSINGEKIVMRLLPLETILYSLGELGLNMKQTRLIRQSIASRSGMILIAGPTGSGKTTTLYAILQELINEPINIMTIENPVEYRLESVTQVEVNEKAGVSFSNALRSFLRQDPDVILIGEIRDQETAEIAARAAQTGHLVLSTVHSNTVFETLQRLKNLGVSSDDLGSSVKLIMSQRLLRKRCACLGKEVGCPRCGGRGVAGRTPVLELLPLDAEMRQLLLDNASLRELESLARRQGFKTLRENGQALVKQQVILETDLASVIL